MDIRTIILLLAISSFVFGLLLIVFQHEKSSLNTHVVRYWIIAKFLQGTGSVLLYLDLPFELLFLIAEGLIILGCAYECWAIYYITDHPVNQQIQRWVISSVLIICLLSFSLDLSHRAAVLFLLHSCFYALPAGVLLRKTARSLLRSVLGMSYGILAVLFANRALCMTLMPHDMPVIWQQICDGTLPLAVFCIVLMSGFSLLLLASDKSYRLLKATQDSLRASEEALRLANTQLAQLSKTDSLTGIANRRYFDECLTLEYKRLARHQLPLSLVLLDIDYFKDFNDYYGHLAGDECLIRVATTIAACLQRPFDLAARYGGEEFACILPETDENGAWQLAENMRIAIEQLAIPHQRSAITSHVTASLGIATIYCEARDRSIELLAQADQALYAAKRAGRNQVAGKLIA